MPDGWLEGDGATATGGTRQGDVSDPSRDERPVPGTTYHAVEPLAPLEPRLGFFAALRRRLSR